MRLKDNNVVNNKIAAVFTTDVRIRQRFQPLYVDDPKYVP